MQTHKKIFYSLFLCFYAINIMAVQPLMLKNEENEDPENAMYVRGDKDFSLIMAAWKGDIESVRRLIVNGANINATTDDGITPLIYATELGNYEICFTLVKAGADANLHDNNGQSALISSAKNGQRFIADLLLRNGAMVNKKDNSGRTALHYTSVWSDTGFISLLLRSGANINIRDADSTDALLAATINGNIENILFLLNKGANVNTTDNYGISALMVAVGAENFELIKILLENGADINLISKNQQSALSIAIQLQNETLVNFLIDNNANVNALLNRAVTPLTIAKYYKRNNTIPLLLIDKGATENSLPNFGRYFIGPEISFNNSDFMVGLGGGIRELKFGFDINTGFWARPFAIKSEKKEINNWYQFWEHKYSYYLGINKNIIFFIPQFNIQTGIFLGAKGIVSVLSYKSVNYSPKPEYTIMPEIGWFIIWRGLQFNTHYNYFNSFTNIVNNNKIGMSIKFIIGSKKQFNVLNYSKWNKKTY